MNLLTYQRQMQNFSLPFNNLPYAGNSLQKALLKLGTIRFYKTGSCLHSPNETGDKMFFLKKGLVHIYRLAGHSRKTCWLSSGGETLCCLNRFFGAEVCDLNFEALEYTEALVLSYDHIAQLLEQNDLNLQVTGIISSHYYRIHEFFSRNTGTASDRYEQFLERFPGMQNRVSSKIIASFIDVTPKTITRLRSCKNKMKLPIVV